MAAKATASLVCLVTLLGCHPATEYASATGERVVLERPITVYACAHGYDESESHPLPNTTVWQRWRQDVHAAAEIVQQAVPLEIVWCDDAPDVGPTPDAVLGEYGRPGALVLLGVNDTSVIRHWDGWTCPTYPDAYATWSDDGCQRVAVANRRTYAAVHLHELGHLLGLYHRDGDSWQNDVMSPVAPVPLTALAPDQISTMRQSAAELLGCGETEEE